jgi:hypothetical protein
LYPPTALGQRSWSYPENGALHPPFLAPKANFEQLPKLANRPIALARKAIDAYRQALLPPGERYTPVRVATTWKGN